MTTPFAGSPFDSRLTRRHFHSALLGTLGAGLAATTLRADESPAIATRPTGMKLSLAAYSFHRFLPRYGTAEQIAAAEMTLEDFIDYCAELDLEGTELTGYYFPKFLVETPLHEAIGIAQSAAGEETSQKFDIARNYLNSIKHRCFRNGLTISGTAIGNDFCMEPGDQLDAQLTACRQWIAVSQLMGAPVIRIFAGKQPSGSTLDDAIERCIDNIVTVLDDAAMRGVHLALENHGGVTSEADDLLRIVNGVMEKAGEAKAAWFGVNFDSGNFRTADPYADLAKIAPYAINAQLKASLSINGEKQPADLGRMVAILKDAEYRGFVALEYEEKADPKQEIPKLIDKLRTLIG